MNAVEGVGERVGALSRSHGHDDDGKSGRGSGGTYGARGAREARGADGARAATGSDRTGRSRVP